MAEQRSRKYRTLFISDIHLGSKPSKADYLLDFLAHHDADRIYLVGDIIDGWRLRRSWHWPQLHNDVVQKLLRKARKGTEIIYIAGNHDEFLRCYQGTHFGGVEVADSIIHEAADGRRYLVLHGDQFDMLITNFRWLNHIGDVSYDTAILLNRGVAWIRRVAGLPYWSFSAWAKQRVKNAMKYIGDFQEIVSHEAKKRGVDGVICGHIHHATVETVGSIRYINTGDWVESCTAVVEDFDGAFSIIRWNNVTLPANIRASAQQSTVEDVASRAA
jgi:UDP-2,3-diacylglucosamine pyrophosphatase LpxH